MIRGDGEKLRHVVMRRRIGEKQRGIQTNQLNDKLSNPVEGRERDLERARFKKRLF